MTITPLLHALNDPEGTAHGALTTLATAGLTLVDPRTLSPAQRLLYRGAVTALTAWVVNANLSEEELMLLGIEGRKKHVITAGMSVAALAAMPLSERLDARVHSALARVGIRRPRIAMSLAAGAIMAGSWWAAKNTPQVPEFEEFDWAESLVDLPPEVRTLLARMLGAIDDFGAAALRTQLEGIQMIDEEPYDLLHLSLVVADDAERAVPGTMTFPVIARVLGPSGAELDLQIHVYEGKLQILMAQEVDEDSREELENWLRQYFEGSPTKRWQWLNGAKLFLETPTGFVPLPNADEGSIA